MRRLIALFVVSAATAALASQPGQPLDCSDVVLFDARYRCTAASSFPCFSDACSQLLGNDRAADNDGQLVFIRRSLLRCGLGSGWVDRVEFLVTTGGDERVIARIDERCVGPDGAARYDEILQSNPERGFAKFSFDSVNGRLLLSVWSFCSYAGVDCPSNYGGGSWIMSIEGFTPLLEVLQSYAPPENLSFRVPVMPEGLPAADRFDTYWGAVTQPLDLANAHPLQCSYPTPPPSVGDYLQITTPVPTPAPGHANYVLTSMTYQGHTRAGRKAGGRRLSGRDAARLPACVED